MSAIAIPDTAASPWRAELRATLALAWPLVLIQLAQVSTVTTDVLFLGWLGADSLAAGALGANAWYILMIFGFGVVLATSPMMAQARGAKRHSLREIRRSLRQGVWAAIAWTVPATLILWHSGPLMVLLGQDPAIAAAAQDYACALAPGFLGAFGFLSLRLFASALERPRAAMVVMLAAFAVNAVLAWGLIFGRLGMPALGLIGAGIATTIANWFSALAMLGWVLADRRTRRFRILGRFWRADWPRFLAIWRLGLPIAGVMVLEVAVFSGAVYVMGWIGTHALAAHQIAIQCAATTFMVPLGLAQAATVRVGLAVGAGDREGTRRAGWTAIALGAGFMAAMAVVMALGRRPLAEAFLDMARPDSLPVAALAMQFLVVAALFQPFDGAQVVAIGALRGLADTRAPMLFAVFGYWVVGCPVGLALAFGAGWGGVGIWWGLALGLAVVAALATRRFAMRERLGLVRARP